MAKEKQKKPLENKKIKDSSDSKDMKDVNLFAVIRISGMVKVNKDIAETLERLKLRRKYSCVLINSKNENLIGMLNKSKYHVAYGNIDKEVLEKLIKERAESKEGRKKEVKVDVKEIVNGLIKGKKLSDFGLKDFFRLHPPRRGIKSKLYYPKGVLGDNRKDINKLIERMLWWQIQLGKLL